MNANQLIRGKSPAAELIRTLDWAGTSLGAVEFWTETLLSFVNMMLSAPVPMQLFWGPEFICIYNDAMVPALSTKHPRSLGQPAQTVWKEAWSTIGPQMESVLASGEAVSFRNALVPLLRDDALEDRYWTYSYSPVFGKSGEVLGVIDIAQDTTETVLGTRAEAARRASEQRLADFTVATNDVLYEMSADWSVMFQLDGRSFLADTLTADADWLQKYVYPADQAIVRREIDRAIRTKTNFELEYRIVRAAGSLGWTLSRAVPSFDEDGRIVQWLGAARDITDRKEAEEDIRNGRAQLMLALESAHLASWFYDPNRGVVGGDALMAKFFGLSDPEGPAEIWLAAIVEEDRERVGREFAAGIQGAPYDTEYRVRVGEEVRWIRARAKLTKNLGEITRMLGVCEDVTDRKRAELSLNETFERLALAQQVGNIAAWEWNIQEDRLIWDKASAWVYGRTPDELTSFEAIRPLIHKEDIADLIKSLGPALEGRGEFNHEFRVCWPDGSYHWLIGRGVSILDDQGRVARLNGVNIDITDRRTTELALRQSEKLAAVGQMASTISHEINNPLEAVTNLLYLSKAATEDPSVSEYLSTAEIESRRISAITNQTLRFHRQQSGPTEISCVDLFTSALLIFQGRINNAGIQVEKRKRAEKPIACLEGEIRQVMNNLIGNAIDAMKQGGRLLVRSAEATDWKTGRRGLRLSVGDTGTGMSKETLRHLYQPFFTTKGINGTGLGLWVSQEIVQRHKGRLSVRSSVNRLKSGTVFSLFLPYDPEL